MDENRVTYFAQTDSRSKKTPFGLKAKDRTKHVYVIGKTGMGKSTLLENMAVQDIQNGEGLAFIDPHGKTAELLLEYIPEHRIKDVLYFAPFDLEQPVCFNVLEKVDADKRHLVVSGLMSTFKKIWVDAWSARMEYILGNTLLALLEYPDATLLGVNRMLADKEYRKKVVENVTDPSVKSFWVDEFAKYTEKFAAEATPAIQNKIGQFTNNALIRNMIGQPQSSFDIRRMMDEKKIIIVNLSKGRIGESNANLLGGMLITKIYLAAMSRADVPDRVLKTLPNFYLYVDEFQSFANESFADILSEARKYKLNLTIAHQYIEQMEEEVRAAVFGNVGTMIAFRVGAYDAEVLEKEFAPQFTAEDIVNLGFAQIYLKLMIDGISSHPFSATTLPPIKEPQISFKDKAVAESRAQFAKLRTDVEQNIKEWHQPVTPSAPKPKPKIEIEAGSHREGIAVSLSRPVAQSAQASHVSPAPHASPSPAQSVPVRPRPENDGLTLKQKIELVMKAEAEKAKTAMVEPEQKIHKEPVIVKKEVTSSEFVSLNQLKGKSSINTGKEPTKKNVDELRKALAFAIKPAPPLRSSTPLHQGSAVHASSAGQAPKSEYTSERRSLAPLRSEGQAPKHPTHSAAPAPRNEEASRPYVPRSADFSVPKPPKEVPEEVLKQILKVE